MNTPAKTTATTTKITTPTTPPSIYECQSPFLKRLRWQSMEKLPESPLLSPITQHRFTERETKDMKQFVNGLNTLFDQQRKINRVNMSLNCVNLMTNVANVVRTQNLNRATQEINEALDESRETIVDLEERITKNETTIDSLQTSVSHLEEDVKHTQSKLAAATQYYHAAIGELKQQVSQYRHLLDSHQRMRLKKDFTIDVALGLLSTYLSTTMGIKIPLKLIITIMPITSKQMKQRVYQILKWITTIALYFIMRKKAQDYGFHNAIGSVTSYTMAILQSLFEFWQPFQ